MTTEQPVPLSELARDLPAPAGGWAVELAGRGVAVIEDDLGRPAVDRSTARALFAEARERQEAKARKQAELEQKAVEEDRRFRAGLPAGVPMSEIPTGMSPAEVLMAADPMQGPRRESVLEHALRRRDGAVYHPLHPSEDAS
jgi:hypothetical protein